ncbi:MAG: hypothetical protein J5J06_18130 [Phycisphaerae bacterium]|nr:hypothetical protein [Phycisphaerae bacterium]
MSPIYAQCPYCTFPVVVPAIEQSAPRHCRQCRRRFVPEHAVITGREPAVEKAETGARRRQRFMALRTFLQPRKPKPV